MSYFFDKKISKLYILLYFFKISIHLARTLILTVPLLETVLVQTRGTALT